VTSLRRQDNWDNLMTNLDYHKVERPAMPIVIETELAHARATETDLVQQVTEFYTKHNPAKLEKLQGILFRYKGREAELLRDLKEKYGDGPGVGAASVQTPPPASERTPLSIAQQPCQQLHPLELCAYASRPPLTDQRTQTPSL
jgi:hypothetical protein